MVKVIARDIEGREAAQIFKIVVGENQTVPDETPDTTGEPEPLQIPLNVPGGGRPGLMEQLRAMGRGEGGLCGNRRSLTLCGAGPPDVRGRGRKGRRVFCQGI